MVAQQKAAVAALTVVVTAVAGGTGDAPRSSSARPVSASSTQPVITVEDAAARQELNAAIKEASHLCMHADTALVCTICY